MRMLINQRCSHRPCQMCHAALSLHQSILKALGQVDQIALVTESGHPDEAGIKEQTWTWTCCPSKQVLELLLSADKTINCWVNPMLFDAGNVICSKVPNGGCWLQGFETWMPWAANPLYALLHESIYCQGAASAWAADRVRRVRSWPCLYLSCAGRCWAVAASLPYQHRVLHIGCQHHLDHLVMFLRQPIPACLPFTSCHLNHASSRRCDASLSIQVLQLPFKGKFSSPKCHCHAWCAMTGCVRFLQTASSVK